MFGQIQVRKALAATAITLMMGGLAFAGTYDQPGGYDQPGRQYAPQPQQRPMYYIETDKREYGENERIHVHFKVPPNLSSGAWVGMLDAGYPHGSSDENDKHDLTYQYLSSKLEGELVFDAPKQPGNYDLRVNDSGREYFAVPFTVVEKSFVHAMPGVSMAVNKQAFKPNETIHLQFQGTPDLSSGTWVGLLSAGYPHGSSDENDKHDLAYQYLNSRLNGDLTFTAPSQPGKYDFRLNDGGREYYFVPFVVTK